MVVVYRDRCLRCSETIPTSAKDTSILYCPRCLEKIRIEERAGCIGKAQRTLTIDTRR